ncbi:MAG: anthrone oxygenase family protein [Bacteroidota bacterium]
MEITFKGSSLFVAILLTGLSAGLFYAWEISVIPGNRRIEDKAYVESMQAINRAILNPAFYTIFFGSLIFLLLNTYAQFQSGLGLAFYLILGASLSYLIGTFGVTVFGNVPLNEGLDLQQIGELSKEALAEIRHSYEQSWNRLHSIRTWFSVLALLLSLLAAFTDKQQNLQL